MDDNDIIKNQTGGPDKQNCDCEGNCCPSKKNNKVTKIIFTIVLLAAIGVIAYKLVNKSAPVAVQESCCPEKNTAGNDTTKTATCDTTKGSSCCPK